MSTEAQIRASTNFNRRQANMMVRTKPEEGQQIRDAAKRAGQSTQAYILQAVRERMEKEKDQG